MRRLLLACFALVLVGCSAVPDTFACAHCACSAPDRGLSRPLMCSTIGREGPCCTPVYFEF